MALTFRQMAPLISNFLMKIDKKSYFAPDLNYMQFSTIRKEKLSLLNTHDSDS